MRRALAIVAGVALVLGALGLWWLFSSLDALVARAIEREGSRVLGVPVQVGRVSLELSEGRGTVHDLRVANPEGFSTEPALRVEEIVLGLRPAAVRARPRVIDEVRVGAPVALVEVDAEGRANLDVLRRHAARAGEASPRDEGAEAPGGDGEEAAPLVLRRLTVEEGRVIADLTAAGGERRELALSPLRMRDVGGETGAPPGEIAAQVARRLLANVAAAVAAERIGTFLEGKIDEGLDEAGEAAKEVLRSLLGRDREPSAEEGERAAPE